MSGYQRRNGDIVEFTATDLEAVRSYKNNYTDSTRPLAADECRWSAQDMGNLWIGMLVSIAVYQVVSGLIVPGTSRGEALFTVVLGRFLAMVFAVVLGHFGTKYDPIYPVLYKIVFGSKGTVAPSLVRGILDCFWPGVQAWVGGQTVNAILAVFLPFWNGLGFKGLFISFLILWLTNMYTADSGSDAVQKLERFAAPVLILLSFTVTIWGMYTIDWSILGLLSEPSIQRNPGADSWKLFFPTLLSMIAFDGGITLSIASFTRSCKAQEAQMVGQPVGAPVMMIFIASVGIRGTAGASLTFYEAIWRPVVLASKSGNPAIIIIFSPFIIMAMLTANMAANLVPPTNVLATLFVKKANCKKAALIAAVLAPFAQLWNALTSIYDLIYSVCGLLGVLLGPISGLYLVFYPLEHRTHMDMVDLYCEDRGRYYYKGGWSTATIAIFLVATAVIIAGKYITPLNFLFDNAHVVGSVGAGLSYYIYLKIQNKRNGVNKNDEDNHQTRYDCVIE